MKKLSKMDRSVKRYPIKGLPFLRLVDENSTRIEAGKTSPNSSLLSVDDPEENGSRRVRIEDLPWDC